MKIIILLCTLFGVIQLKAQNLKLAYSYTYIFNEVFDNSNLVYSEGTSNINLAYSINKSHNIGTQGMFAKKRGVLNM